LAYGSDQSRLHQASWVPSRARAARIRAELHLGRAGAGARAPLLPPLTDLRSGRPGSTNAARRGFGARL